jgi:hypothetical protein
MTPKFQTPHEIARHGAVSSTDWLDGNSKDSPQASLFDVDPAWREQWKGMPEFVQADNEAYQKITISFRSWDDVKKFGELIGQRVTQETDTLWFPKPTILPPKAYIYADEP